MSRRAFLPDTNSRGNGRSLDQGDIPVVKPPVDLPGFQEFTQGPLMTAGSVSVT